MDEDVERLVKSGPSDIMVMHDVPCGVPVKSDLRLPSADLMATKATRLRLRRAVDALMPANVFAGHWHQRVIGTIVHLNGRRTRVDVLNMNSSRDGNAVLVWVHETRIRIEPLQIRR